jgi:hypothetical protein
VTPLAIAEARADTATDPLDFLLGYSMGRHADERRLDSEGECWGLIAAGRFEGLAAVRATAGWPTVSSAPFWRRHRLYQRPVAAPIDTQISTQMPAPAAARATTKTNAQGGTR